jgi:hypothetical protein
VLQYFLRAPVASCTAEPFRLCITRICPH